MPQLPLAPEHDGGHDNGGGHNMPMAHKMHKMWMWFHTELNDTVLFEFWTVNSAGELLLSAAILFFVAFFLEALKYWKLTLERRSTETYDLPYRQKLLSTPHFISTALFAVQITVSYLLMLAFMTFNIWLGLSVVLGTVVGFYVFGAKPPGEISRNGCLYFGYLIAANMAMDMMIMYFHTRVREHILFQDWFPQAEWQFVLSCIAVLILGAFAELFKAVRLFLYRRADRVAAERCCNDYGAINGVCPQSDDAAELPPYATKHLLDPSHQIQSLLYFVQIFFSYSLMLISMTYNTPIFVTLMLGHIIGYFFLDPLYSRAEKLRVAGGCCCA